MADKIMFRNSFAIKKNQDLDNNDVMKQTQCQDYEMHDDIDVNVLPRKLFDVNDAQAALDLLSKLNEESSGKFSFRIQLDQHQRLKCIVWVDPRCLSAYQHFGDIVAFDTTYRTNRYSMPFLLFTGVNHHYQTIIFGFALMRDDDFPAFKWVLSSWLEAVGNKQPVAIITDQGHDIGKAIASTLPESYHLLFSSHINNNFADKLAIFYSKYPNSFKVDFNNCVYNSLIEETFESRWEDLVHKYNLEDHTWLQGMYEIKRKWVPAYTKSVFTAGQTTTSRNEEMNAFFDKYVSSSTGMKEFIENAQKALERQFMREKEEDYKTTQWKRGLKMHTMLEYHGASVYTKEMFSQFQNQLVETLKYFVVEEKVYSNDDEKLYKLYRQLMDKEKRNHYYVLLNVHSNEAFCICRMYEHLGIPCRHILAVLHKRRVAEIPQHFVMRRWTAQANRPYDMNNDLSLEMSQALRLKILTMAGQRFCEVASKSVERYNYAMGVIRREIAIVEKMEVEDTESRASEIDNKSLSNTMPEHVPVPLIDPIASQRKGRKNVKHPKGPIEMIGDAKPMQKCAFCKVSTKHDKQNCPVRLVLLREAS